jgi:FkbM family methyltransferase
VDRGLPISPRPRLVLETDCWQLGHRRQGDVTIIKDASKVTELVFDIGMHDGNDTAYYLARGYNVVAVEANPALCATAEQRFAAEIAAGRLTIVNVGITDQAGQLEFWISEKSVWSSFDKNLATSAGVAASAIVVRTIRFSELLRAYPAPLYIKIDIEGNDSLCIHDLAQCSALPAFVSFEGHDNATRDMRLLASLGYEGFKCVRQCDWREITSTNMSMQRNLRRLMASVSRHRRAQNILQAIHYRRPRRGEWKFEFGSSGPLGRELPGRWMTCDEAVDVWKYEQAVMRDFNDGPFGEWFDIHAASTDAMAGQLRITDSTATASPAAG